MSNQLQAGGKRTVILTRAFKGMTSSHYTFDPAVSTLNVINAIGRGTHNTSCAALRCAVVRYAGTGFCRGGRSGLCSCRVNKWVRVLTDRRRPMRLRLHWAFVSSSRGVPKTGNARVSCLVSRVSCLVSRVSCLVSRVSCVAPCCRSSLRVPRRPRRRDAQPAGQYPPRA